MSRLAGALLFLLVLVTALAIVAPSPVEAGPQSQAGLQVQAGVVEMALKPAFGGYVKYGEWLPLRVSVRNLGGDLDAELRTTATSEGLQFTYALPAPLPAGAQKEFVLYAQVPSFARTVTVELASQDRVLGMATADVHPTPNIAYIAGLVAPDAGPYGLLDGLEPEGTGRTIVLIPLALRDLPERAEAFRTFDALFLGDTDTTGLTPAQADALSAWTANGGRLVLAGGPGAARTLAGLPAVLKPAALSAPIRSDAAVGLAALAAFANAEAPASRGEFAAVGPAAAFGRPLVTESGRPLISEQAYGKGRIDYLAFDPALQPFAAWAGMRLSWAKLLAPGSAYPQGLPPDASEGQMFAQRLGFGLTNMPSLDFPSVRWLALLLGVYVLLVGPANYLVLRRLGRLDWAWVSIPALTLLFAGGAFGAGYRFRGSDVIVNQITVVRMPSAGALASVRSYVGVFSPARRPYNISIDRDSLVGPMSSEPSRFGGGPIAQGSLTVVQGRPALVRDMYINQWSMQGFQAERYAAPGEWQFPAGLRFAGSRLQGTIHNGTGQDLTDVFAVAGSRFARLGDVPAGTDVTVDHELQGGSGSPFPYGLFEEAFARSGPGGPPREAMVKQNLLDAVFNFAGTKGGAAPAGIVILGWFEGDVLGVELKGGQATHLRTGLLVVEAPLVANAGQVTLPPGSLASRLEEIQGGAGNCGPGSRVFMNPDSQATIEYTLPEGLRAVSVTVLTISVSNQGEPFAAPPAAELYDWTARRWVELPELRAGDNIVDSPSRYVDPSGGKIRLRLRGGNDLRAACFLYDVGLEAKTDG